MRELFVLNVLLLRPPVFIELMSMLALVATRIYQTILRSLKDITLVNVESPCMI